MTIQSPFQKSSFSYLYRRRKVLAQRIALLVPNVLTGTLVEMYTVYGQNQNHGSSTKKHHSPRSYLSSGQNTTSMTKTVYVPKRYKKQVQEYLSNFQDLQKLTHDISLINREILKRRGRL